MWKRFKLVALTYFTRKLFWLFLAAFLLMSLPGLFARFGRVGDDFSRHMGMLLPKLFFQMYVGFLVGANLKQQFANPRSRLLPGFHGSHLGVALW